LLDELVYGDRELKNEAFKAEIRILLEKGEYEEFLKKAEAMINVEENNVLWNIKGVALINLGRNEEALAFWTLLDLNPKDSNIWDNKGVALLHLRRNEEALKAVSESLELSPEDTDVWKVKGFIHLRISLDEFKSNNCGNALKNLDAVMDAFDTFHSLLKDEKEEKIEIYKALTYYLKDLIDAKNVKAVDMALESIGKNKKGLKELFKPVSTAVEIVKSRDVSKYYELQVERREVVADIVKRLTGSEELLVVNEEWELLSDLPNHRP
jgi:tetratricopeptide (TPR) repeat protein